MQTEDGSIIHRCLNGESEAFGLLVDKYKPGIYAYVYNKLNNLQDAQDVTQEVFLQAYRGLPNLRKWESFTFWLYRIAFTRCKMWLRTQSRRIDQEFIEDQESNIILDISLGLYRDGQLDESIRESLDMLPEIYREVVILYYFGGVTSANIAKALGTSPTAVRRRLTRARMKLKKEIVSALGNAFGGKELQASFTFQIVKAIKHIKFDVPYRTPKIAWGLPLAMSMIGVFLNFGLYFGISDGYSPRSYSPAELRVQESGEIHLEILKIDDIPALAADPLAKYDQEMHLSENFEGMDISGWNGAYYNGRADLGRILNKTQYGTPIIALSPNAASSGNSGLWFVKDRQFLAKPPNYSAIISSPEFGPMTDLFCVKFDIIPDKNNHIIWLGKSSPDKTDDERQISNLGITFDRGEINIRAKGFPSVGRYAANTFYSVIIIADPKICHFNLVVDGELYDTNGNRLPYSSIRRYNLEFESPASEIRYINLYTGSHIPPISMGLDNLQISKLYE